MKILSKFILVVFASALLFAAVFVFSPAEKRGSATGTASISEAFPLALKSERILLQGPGGGVWVNNFYKVAKAAIPEENAVLVIRAAEYDIFYFRERGSFELALGISASEAAKSIAENSLFGILGIGKQELCKLNVLVSSLSSGGDKEYSRLSFCQSVFRTQ